MSIASTASASVSVAVDPLTATGLVAARLTSRSVPPRVAFTVNALAAGTDAPSRPPSKVRVSAVPFTDADWYAGGVLLGTLLLNARLANGTRLPDRSLSLLAVSSGEP